MYPGVHARTMPDKPAVIMADTGRVVTYAELDDESVRLARLLRGHGIGPGDRIALLLDNDPRFLTVCWAAHRTGLTYVPINWHLTEDEMRYIVEDCGARALITNGVRPELAATLRRGAPEVRVALSLDASVDGFDDFDAAIASQPGGELEDESEGTDMLYTSGTTGRPKGGVRRPRGQGLRTARPGGFLVQARMGMSEDSVHLTPGSPMYHAAQVRFDLVVTRLGATNVIMDRFDPRRALEVIEEHSVTHSQWVPTMFVRMLRLPEEERRAHDLSSHRRAIHTAAPCPVWVKEQIIDWWGPIVEEYYGGSEGGCGTYISCEEWLEHKGSVGRPMNGTLHIVDDEGRELPPGEAGGIYCENGLPVQYLNDPEKTDAAHSPQGWVTVGDVGYLDDEGYLYLTDRKHNMIISGGVNIYPQETEDVLVRHPKVADVAVIGVPNEEWGEEVKAVVELLDPSDASPELAEELVAYCRDHLAHYKCPKSVDFEAELPRTPAGKLYKRRLRDRYWADRSSSLV